MTDPIATKPYASQAQQRWAHATGQSFARRWDALTDFSTLPKRVKRLMQRAAGKAAPKADYPDQSQFAGHTMEDWDDTKPDSFYKATPAKTKAWSAAARAAALATRRRNAAARHAGQPAKSPRGAAAPKPAGTGRAAATPRPATAPGLAHDVAGTAQQAAGGDLARDIGQTAQQAAGAAPVAPDRALAVAERRIAQLQKKLDKLRKGGGGKKPTTTTTTSAAELRAQIRFAQGQADRAERQQRQAAQDAQRAQDRADRIARRREARVPAARNNLVTGAGTNRIVRHKEADRVALKLHVMSRDEEKAMFANLAKSGKLRRRKKPATAAVGGARKPAEQPTETLPGGVKPGQTVGETTKAYGADPNTSYTLRHELVDMADIEASNTQGGGINPKYDPSLQPRDRSRASSQAQIGQVAQQLNPEVLTTDFHRIDAGSPIVDAKGNVLSGNGRTLALQRAAELHPDKYADYKAQVKAQALEHGIDPSQVDKMKNPVLVRRLQGDADAAAFAREANSSGTLRMSPLEQAKVDAGQISDRHMLKLNVTEGMDIDRALRDKSNKPFIDDFLKSVPDNERANLLTRNGDLNQMGLYRAKAAIYTRAFPGASGERLAESMLESLDPEVKSIQNGISGALPSFSRATSLTRSGMRDAALDISDDLAQTIDVYARIKDNPNLTAGTPASQLVAKYLDQSSMFDRELTPQQERLLVHLDKIARKPTEVRALLDRYAKIVEDQPPPGQASLFGEAGNLTRAELYDLLLGDTPMPAAQAGMF